MNPGEGFGELALMYNSKRTATVQAGSEEVETYVLDGKVFKTIVIKSSLDKRSFQNQFLNKVQIFSKQIHLLF
jgi:CRP-like cAMP-binding protein